MKGTILSFIFGGIIFWSLNLKVFDNFFKIKRQRLYKASSENDEIINNKVANIKSNKLKRRNRPLK
ncbi:MAG: hypothetical protein U0354_00830 [Candidatus Sericytochromatia bacterium]